MHVPVLTWSVSGSTDKLVETALAYGSKPLQFAPKSCIDVIFGGPWASHLIYFGVSCPVYEMGIILVTLDPDLEQTGYCIQRVLCSSTQLEVRQVSR